MRRILFLLVGAAAVAVPATPGVLGNASFAERLRVPSPPSTVTFADHGDGDVGDDHGGNDSDDYGHDGVDDHGGDGSGGHGSDG